MGGCCSSSRKLHLHGTPTYYYYSPYSEEHESLASHDAVATILTSGMLIDLNLDMSIPDTFRSPPAPLPYDAVLGHPISTDFTSQANPKEAKSKSGYKLPPESPRKANLELLKQNSDTSSATNDEDTCPTCLEEYDVENPKIMTQCNHHFHLSCILEWMERSNTCPVCSQEMIYEVL